MSDPFVGEIRPWACTFAPQYWAFCRGQLLPIPQNTALFSLLGTYYGGNGTSTFGLPDLQGRVPMKFGTNSGNTYDIGQQGGEENIQLQSGQMPTHTHTFSGASTAANSRSAPSAGCSLGTTSSGDAFYAASNSSLTAINPGTVSTYPGGNGSHPNLQPFLAINWCIALRGIFPARN